MISRCYFSFFTFYWSALERPISMSSSRITQILMLCSFWSKHIHTHFAIGRSHSSYRLQYFPKHNRRIRISYKILLYTEWILSLVTEVSHNNLSLSKRHWAHSEKYLLQRSFWVNSIRPLVIIYAYREFFFRFL